MTTLRALLFGMLLVVAGCGYQFGDAATQLPGGVARVAVELFANETTEPYLDRIVTDGLTNRLVGQSHIGLADSRGNAEAVLSGKVVEYNVTAISYDALDNIQSYRVTLAVDAHLQSVTDDRILWRGRVVRFEDFVSSGADITVQDGLERAALDRIVNRVAEDLSWQMTSDFGMDK